MLCLVDLAGVTPVEGVWDLDFEGALLSGLMLAGEGEDYHGVGTFSVEQGQCPRLSPIGRQCRRDKHPIPLTEHRLPLLEQRPLPPK